MKKLYTVLLAAIVGMVCSFGASAQDNITLTFNVDRADAVEWKTAYSNPWNTLDQGENVIEVDPYYGSYYYLYMRPKAGSSLDKITSADPDSYPDLRDTPVMELNEFTLYPDASWEGRVYNIVTSDLNEARTGSLTVDISGDPSLVEARLTGAVANMDFAATGETVVKFNPETELPITFYASGGTPFYIFQLNGTEVAPNGSSYEVTPAATGDRVTIDTSWPEDLMVQLTVNVGEDVTGAVSNIQYQDGWQYYDQEGWTLNEPFDVKAGRRYKVTYNTTDYTVSSTRVNGELVSGTYSVDFFVGKDATTVDIEAAVKQALKFYFIAERAGEAEFDVTGYGSYTKLEAGENAVFPQENSWGGYNSVYLRAVDNFKLTRVYCEETGDELAVPTDPSSAMYISPNESWLFREYKVETTSLDDIRTASVTVTIEDSPSAIVRAQRGTSSIDLTGVTAGEPFTVKFDPATESKFTFAGNSVPLCSVRLNGVEMSTESATSPSHIFTVEDGDEIEIKAEYDGCEYLVTITVPDGTAGVINKVDVGNTYPYETVTWTSGEPFMVKSGTRVSIDLNHDAAKLNTVTVDDGYTDEPLSYDEPWSVTFFVKESAVDVDVDAVPYNTLKFTVNVTDPGQVVIYPGTSTYNTPYTLTGTSNQLEISEKLGQILIQAATGCLLNSVTDGEGNPLEADYWTGAYTVTDGMTINIETSEKVYDGKFVLWFDSVDNLNNEGYSRTYWSNDDDRVYNYVSEVGAGYHIVPFMLGGNVQYSLIVYPKSWARVYSNGVLTKESSSESWPSIYHYFYPADGEVLRVYTTVEEPGQYDLVIEVADGIDEEDVKVTTDKITERNEWRGGACLSCVLEQTLVEFEVPDGAGVSVDGTQLEAGEDGKFSFTTSSVHRVSVSNTSSILNLDGDKAGEDVTVYNLQGIKVIDKAPRTELDRLPAGIYIVNGVKTVVR